MALINLPAKFRFSKINSFRLERRTNIVRSKFTAKRQVVALPFAVWYLDADLLETMMNEQEGREVRAFLALLEGQANTFKLPVPGYTSPSTGYQPVGNEVVSAANVAARVKSFQFANCRLNQALLNPGDYFTVKDELKIVTSLANTDGTGKATVNFMPPTRKALVAGDAITLTKPYAVMSALADDVADWQIGPPVRQRAKFEAVEAF